MRSMKSYLSMDVWSFEQASEVGRALLGTLVLLAITPGLISAASVSVLVPSVVGWVVLHHLALHGWTLSEGTLGQRALLGAIVVVAIGACAGLAHLVGV